MTTAITGEFYTVIFNHIIETGRRQPKAASEILAGINLSANLNLPDLTALVFLNNLHHAFRYLIPLDFCPVHISESLDDQSSM